MALLTGWDVRVWVEGLEFRGQGSGVRVQGLGVVVGMRAYGLGLSD